MDVDGAVRSPSCAVPIFLSPDGSDSLFPRVGAEIPQHSQHKPRWAVTQDAAASLTHESV